MDFYSDAAEAMQVIYTGIGEWWCSGNDIHVILAVADNDNGKYRIS